MWLPKGSLSTAHVSGKGRGQAGQPGPEVPPRSPEAWAPQECFSEALVPSLLLLLLLPCYHKSFFVTVESHMLMVMGTNTPTLLWRSALRPHLQGPSPPHPGSGEPAQHRDTCMGSGAELGCGGPKTLKPEPCAAPALRNSGLKYKSFRPSTHFLPLSHQTQRI